jgi:hypothetical protein
MQRSEPPTEESWSMTLVHSPEEGGTGEVLVGLLTPMRHSIYNHSIFIVIRV